MDNRQLEAWRLLAARALGMFIPKISGSEASAQDDQVDNLLRALNNQGPRPNGSPPYVGLFGDRPLQDLRQRAGGGVIIFLEHLDTPGLLPVDEGADSLIRTLRGFSSERPRGVYPYEGLFGFTQSRLSGVQLSAWRMLAGRRLQQLIEQIPDNVPTSADAEADSLLRALSGQPPRPQGRSPYAGLLMVPSTLPFTQLRSRAADALKIFVDSINSNNIGSQDAVIDNAIRSITTRTGVSRLPARPFGRLPYEGLFSRLAEVTEGQLRQIVPGTAASQLRKFVVPINITMAEFDISTPLRQAHFLAQLAHESANFTAVEEFASGIDYEGRADLGNFFPGDGPRFKGRGLIQITGRFNYTACSVGLGLGRQLVERPTRLTEDELAARCGGWFWSTNGLNALADRDDVFAVTRRINGGLNGIDDRIAKLGNAKRAFRI